VSTVIKLPANQETNTALPVGVVVQLADSPTNGGYWNGNRWVKTSPSTWAIVHRNDTADSIAEMVKTRANNVSPSPGHEGDWIIVNPQEGVTLMVQKLASLALTVENHSRGSGRFQRRLNDIESFITDPGEWERKS
jgi:hypothetical protein